MGWHPVSSAGAVFLKNHSRQMVIKKVGLRTERQGVTAMP
jgi:hypothetical protein